MKQRLHYFFFIAACCLCAVSVKATTNLLDNGDFETGDISSWASWKGASAVSIDKNGTTTYAAEGAVDAAYLTQTVALEADKTYCLTFNAKSEDGKETAVISFQNKFDGWAYGAATAVLSTDWEEYTLVFRPQTPDMVSARIALTKLTGKRVWLDDFVLCEHPEGASLSADNTPTAISLGSIDTEQKIIHGLGSSQSLTVRQFLQVISLPAGATATVFTTDKKMAFSTDIISQGHTVRFFAANGAYVDYAILPRDYSTDNTLVSVACGTITGNAITGLLPDITIGQLYGLIVLPDFATAEVRLAGVAAADNTPLTANHVLVVKAESGDERIYTLAFGTQTITQRTISSGIERIKSADMTNCTLAGKCELHILSPLKPINLSTINITSEDAWLFLDSIKPSVVNDEHLRFVSVNGAPAQLDVNVRLVQYDNGCVVIAHTPDYQALTVYDAEEYVGNEMKFGNYTYSTIASLGAMNDNIASFTLRRGYMATFAQNENGTGFSKVYIADAKDIEVTTLPQGLKDNVSYVRVIPWRWPHKKGYPQGQTRSDWLNCSWRYDWNNQAESTLDVEYIPMRHNKGWAAWANIDKKKNSTHVLGFNEPEREDQANMTVDEAIALWPNILKSGLRVGSPCPSDGGLSWLFEFMEKAEARNYRVDFIAMHYYLGCQTSDQLISRLKYVSDRCGGRPIWVTEWNNGATWTQNCIPSSEAEQATKIRAFSEKMDQADFVERYSIYDHLGGIFNMFGGSGYSSPRPGAYAYRDNKAPLAYRAANEFDVVFNVPTPQNFKASVADAEGNVKLTWSTLPADLTGYTIERADGINSTSYNTIYTSHERNTTYTDKVSKHGVYKYRIAGVMEHIGASEFTSIEKTYYIPSNYTNVALRKGTTTNSSTNNYPSSKAVDGDNKTESSRWISSDNDALPHWIEIDLGAEYSIGFIRLWTGYGGYGKPIKNFQLQAWDGAKWVNAMSASGNGYSYYLNTFAPVVTSKVRLNVTASTEDRVRMYELEVYGCHPNEASLDEAQYADIWTYYESGMRYMNLIGLYDEVDVTVVNLSGQVVKRTRTTCDVEVGDLPNGMYLINIDGAKTLKFIKE